ncbi:hypothetical protein FA95DRAFT_1415655 [Auriscalpium vulgare]|uniref:Uncharacterized protein n=1 Tax=Auriscalpium vulgare TaxID=40419 RepID=A0ACB8RQH7_9AGAM|nr:hypothetical protein FA95DRAFT_1415655 [Auriscalpium vulgare]
MLRGGRLGGVSEAKRYNSWVQGLTMTMASRPFIPDHVYPRPINLPCKRALNCRSSPTAHNREHPRCPSCALPSLSPRSPPPPSARSPRLPANLDGNGRSTRSGRTPARLPRTCSRCASVGVHSIFHR